MAIIAPANYILNRNKDIQSSFDNHILLSSEKFTTETDCALEIVFDDKVEEPKSISDNFYLFDLPLPISRVKGIYFKTEEQKINTVFNITSGAAFLPQGFIKTHSEQSSLNTTEISNYKTSKGSKDWETELKTYDKVLGGIALMPISKKDFENYPLNYFGILTTFNKQIEYELKSQDIIPIVNYSWAFEPISKFKSLHDLVYRNVDDKVVRDVALGEKVNVKTRNGLYVLDSIPAKTNTYLSAILATYGKNKRKKIDDFLSDFKANKFEENRREGIALIFGINNGYSSFRNQYEFGTSKTEIKFKLDSKLDFYTIESIYQYVFNRKTNCTTFSYIDNWCPQSKNNNPLSNSFFTILDKQIYLKENNSIGVFESVSTILKKWLPFFDITRLNKEIENEIAKELDEIKVRIQEKNNKIDNLNFEVNQKNKEIENLNTQIQELTTNSLIVKVKDNIEKSIVSQKEHEYKKPIGGLFAEDNSNLTPQEKRADELYSLPTIKELKEIAKKCGIIGLSKYNNKNKQKLIDEIVKNEFKQN